tara:strand:+ start:624 stop:1079 length:456 start_codon:yes stop_codon:yes gene_type:complete
MKIKKNGKVINLTESDLRRIVTKVIKEQDEVPVDGATDQKQWKFPVKGIAKYGADYVDNVVLINKSQLEDPKTGKLKLPFYTVYVKNKAKGRVKIGNLLSTGAWETGNNHDIWRAVAACTMGTPHCEPEESVKNVLKKGIKDSIGITPKGM